MYLVDVGFVWHIFLLGGHGMTCSEWSLSRSLWKKVRRLEKSTPAVLVALVTNYSYEPTFSCVLLKFLAVYKQEKLNSENRNTGHLKPLDMSFPPKASVPC